MKTCKDCGCKVYSGYCVNCNEEHYIEEQYIELDMEVPKSIYDKSRKDDKEAMKRLEKRGYEVINLPIYRAKRIDSDEYIIGYLLPEFKGKFYLSTEWSKDFDGYTPNFVQIDISTLSIHFPDMIDSQGNKIFASLSENSKGGDILIEEGKYDDGFNPIFEPYFRKSSLSIFDLPKTPYGEYQLKHYKIIGIQKEKLC